MILVNFGEEVWRALFLNTVNVEARIHALTP
jgi:hypothetical protein